MLKGNKGVIFLFCIVLNIRLLTEMPRALSLLGWESFAAFDFNRTVSALLLFFCVFMLLLKNRLKIPLSVQHLFFLISTLLFISIFISIDTFRDIGMPISGIFVVVLRYVIEMTLLIFIWNFVGKPEDFDALMRFFFKPALFIFIATSFFQIVSNSYGLIQAIDRIMGPFGSPTTLAGFLHLFIIITIYYYGHDRTYGFWALLGVQYLLMIYTGSVATIGAHLLFLFLLAMKERWIKLKRFYRFFPLVAIVAVSGVILKWESILSRLEILFNLESFELPAGSSLKWRFDAWEAYLSLLKDDYLNWIFGLGVGTHRYILHPDYPNSLWRIFDAPGSHNDYLGILIDFGIVGLILFLAGLVALYRFLRRAERLDRGIFYFRYYFISVLVIMLTENYVDQLIMFVFIIFLAGIYRAAKFRTSGEALPFQPQPNFNSQL
jgi:O-antigen ligase